MTKRRLFGGWKVDRVVQYLFHSQIELQRKPTKGTGPGGLGDFAIWTMEGIGHKWHQDIVIGYAQEQGDGPVELPIPHGWFYSKVGSHFWSYVADTDDAGTLMVKRWLTEEDDG